MLPDLSAWHIAILVIVALVVVGPKELPGLLRKIGQFMSKLRGLANEFRASFDEMARQSELDELRKEVEAMRAAATKPAEELRGHLQPLMTFEAGEPETAVGDPHAVMTPLAEPAASEPAPAQPGPAEATPPKPAKKPRAPAAAKAKPKTEGPASKAKPAAKRTRPKPASPAEPGA